MIDTLFDSEKLRIELDRYDIISQYYKENPSRSESNEDYFIDITDRLVDISFSEQDIPKNIRRKSYELLKFFGKKSRYIF